MKAYRRCNPPHTRPYKNVLRTLQIAREQSTSRLPSLCMHYDASSSRSYNLLIKQHYCGKKQSERSESSPRFRPLTERTSLTQPSTSTKHNVNNYSWNTYSVSLKTQEFKRRSSGARVLDGSDLEPFHRCAYPMARFVSSRETRPVNIFTEQIQEIIKAPAVDSHKGRHYLAID